jgi:branched-chain amino acid transport system permease protein
MRKLLVDGVPGRGWLMLAVVTALLFAAPYFVNDYLITVLILIFYFAYAGQAWNIMMGFAGQLSLGHALYVGIGAYAAAGLYVHFGVGPWIGVGAAVIISGLVAAALGYLAFRFGVGGVYFAILTIAFAEFARIGFDHIKFLGASSGLFLPVAQYASNDLWSLRGKPVMFYYLMLVLMLAALAVCRMLLRSRLGYYWRAIREDEQAAQSLGIDVFGCKIYAVVISAAMTSIAGVFFAFYYNNLFPEQVFHISRSIEIILGPIIGGVGTLAGPIVGAFVLTIFSEGMTELLVALKLTSPGAKQVFYGVALLVVIVLMPHGIWPPIARALGLVEKSDGGDS